MAHGLMRRGGKVDNVTVTPSLSIDMVVLLFPISTSHGLISSDGHVSARAMPPVHPVFCLRDSQLIFFL